MSVLDLHCPYCGNSYRAYIETRTAPAGAGGPFGDDDAYVFQCFLYYLVGRTLRGHFAPVEGEPWTWEFRVQVSDSPEGDTWYSGKLRWCPGQPMRIEGAQYSSH